MASLGLFDNELEKIVVHVCDPTETWEVSASEKIFHSWYVSYHSLHVFLSSNRKLAILNETRNREISPDRTSTDSTETKNRYLNFSILRINKKLKEPIEYGASEIGPKMAGNEKVSENGLGDGFEGGDDVGEEVVGPRVVRGKAVGDGSEAEGGKAGEAEEDIGVVSELAVGVRRVEESDGDAGE